MPDAKPEARPQSRGAALGAAAARLKAVGAIRAPVLEAVGAEPLTLKQHLAKGYDFLVHHAQRGWSIADFAGALKADPEMLAAAQAQLDSLRRILKARGEDTQFVASIHARCLSDALAEARRDG